MDICHKKVPANIMHEGRMVKCFLYGDEVLGQQQTVEGLA
jgi:hypothetical protein